MTHTPQDSKTSPSLLSTVKNWVVQETSGGILLLIGAALALVWANSPWHESYYALSSFVVGPAAVHLNLSLATWAADGLLAIFFFIVGLELKHEITEGSLRNIREAAVPIFAALGGMIMPIFIFVGTVMLLGDKTALHGWAIPVATDIAFALAVLAVFGRGLSRGLRTFLLTLAVVDDLLAIIIIAVFFTSKISWLALGVALACIGAFGFFAHRKKLSLPLLVVFGLLSWGFMHASGVHATIAGVLLGLCVPNHRFEGEKTSRVHCLEEAIRPFNAGIVLPIFAFFAAGVTLIGGTGIVELVGQPIVIAIILGLVVGKFVGVIGVSTLVVRFTKFQLCGGLSLRELLPLGFITGIGFTVSLLIAELSFEDDVHTAGAKFAILAASLISAVIGAFALKVAKKD